MTDHAFKPHEVWKTRDSCEERIDSGDGSGMTSACCLPRRAHPTPEALDMRAAWRALKMVDDAYWGEFCGCCGVILSLESRDEECGPQHTAVQLAHEWLEKNPEPR